MYERLGAPQASRGCLDPATLKAVDLACRQVERPDAVTPSLRESSDELRELIRKSLQGADKRLAERLWAGEDVVQLVRARAWVVEQLLLLACRKRRWRRLSSSCGTPAFILDTAFAP